MTKEFRQLLISAITLKGKFDTGQSIDTLKAYYEIFCKDLDVLSELCPSKILEKGDLLRHAGFIKIYLKKEQPENCFSDIQSICCEDIFFVEQCYNEYLSKNTNDERRTYDWDLIHPIINRVARSRFESQHFADAVEASFKEVNNIIKKQYYSKSNEEEDGDKLMRKAFSTSQNNNFTPIFPLADNSNESGRSIQQGYMDIFAGSMKGIRNPKAHSNITIGADEAWEKLVLASHLIKTYKKWNKGS